MRTCSPQQQQQSTAILLSSVQFYSKESWNCAEWQWTVVVVVVTFHHHIEALRKKLASRVALLR